MAIMHRRRLLKRIDIERVRHAIKEAEKQTSGEFRVSVSRYFWGNVRPVAERAFQRLQMRGTKQRNAVLFFIVPSRKRFVVLGDEALHAKVGQKFWDQIADAMSGHFRKGEFTDGIISGIKIAAEAMAVHFPYDAASDVNELPDDIDFGKQRQE